MANYHLKEKGLSLKAKGLLSLMLSLPENWDYSIEGLIQLGIDKKTAIETALKELKDFGYLRIKRFNSNETESGHFEYEYIIYEEPQKSDSQPKPKENKPKQPKKDLPSKTECIVDNLLKNIKDNYSEEIQTLLITC